MSQSLITSEDFNEIPVGWQLPGSFTEVKPIRTGAGLTAFPARGLVIGHLGFEGVATANVAYTVYNRTQGALLFGLHSTCYDAIDAWLTGAPSIPIDVIGVVDLPANGPAAQYTVTLAGQPAAATNAVLLVNGVTYPFVVDPATNAAAWCANLVAALAGLQADWLQSAVVNGTVVLTVFRKGADGNDFDIRPSPNATDLVPGLQFSVAQTQVSPSNPSISAALAGVSATWYTDIVSCFSDVPNLQLLQAEGARRYAALAKLDCRIYFGFQGTYAQTLALAAQLNSQFMNCIAAQNPRWTPWCAAAAYGAACAYALNQDPARQCRTLVLAALAGLAPVDADLFLDQQRNVLLGSGISTFTVEQDGTVEIERAVTTYQRSSTNVADTAWQDIMVPSVMTRIRYDWDAYMQETYPRSKLAPDGGIAAQYATDVLTPARAKASWIGRCKLYEQLGWIENSATTGPLSVFSIDASNKNRLNCALPVQIIGNAMTIASSLQFEV